MVWIYVAAAVAVLLLTHRLLRRAHFSSLYAAALTTTDRPQTRGTGRHGHADQLETADAAIRAAEALSMPARALWTLTRIDSGFVEAVSLASERLDGDPAADTTHFGFLSHARDHFGTYEDDAFRPRVLRYVDEQQAADLLHILGLQLSVPDAPTDVDWDLLVGHGTVCRTFVDAKTWRSADALDLLARSGPGRLLLAPTCTGGSIGVANVRRLDGLSYLRARSNLLDSLDLGNDALIGQVLDAAENSPSPTVLALLEVTRHVRACRLKRQLGNAVASVRVDGRHLGAAASASLASTRLHGQPGSQEGPYRHFESLGRRLREGGAYDVLDERLSAPVERSVAALAALQPVAAADRRSWQWRLWPQPVQVLRQAACEVGLAELGKQLGDLEAGRERLARMRGVRDADARLGALATGAPDLVVGSDVKLRHLLSASEAQLHGETGQSARAARHRRGQATG